MLITGVEVDGVADRDVRIADGRIAEVGRGLVRAAGEPRIFGRGGALIPGLHDHHLHLFALAAAAASLGCGPPEVEDREALGRVLRAADPGSAWVRGVGYCEAVAGDLDRAALDALLPERPVRIQHRSGALWIVNSLGARLLRLDDADADEPGIERDEAGRATGRLFRLDAWLRERLGPSAPPSLGAVSRRLARDGVVGVTDASAGNGPAAVAAFAAALAGGALRQRVRVMGDDSLAGETSDFLSLGERKVLLDERDLPGFDALRARFAAAHAAGRCVAVHCVTRAELVLAAGALRAAGPRAGDRIEHAGVAPPESLPLLAACGVTVVTQPNFLRERGDAYLADVDPADRAWLYRGRGLLDAGIPLGGGTDAPFGRPDPWAAMQAAVDRRSRGGQTLGRDEALSPERALALFTSPAEAPGGPPRRVAPGARADLCLLREPWRRAREILARDLVAMTFVAGRPVWPVD